MIDVSKFFRFLDMTAAPLTITKFNSNKKTNISDDLGQRLQAQIRHYKTYVRILKVSVIVTLDS